MLSAKKNSRERVSRKEPVLIRPVFVSQHTAPAVLGFRSARAFLEWALSSGCRVVERGKDRLVLVEEAEAALLRSGVEQDETPASPPEDEPQSAAAVLARIGRRQAGAR
jgi:hypothetical protein